MLEAYDRNLKKTAVLENAYATMEEKKLNGVGRLTFRLPSDDPKRVYLEPLTFVRLEDGDYYRILIDGEDVADTGERTYEAEHAIATLVDDIMFGAHIIGGSNMTTKQVAEYILSKQTVKRWQAGTFEISKQFEYGFESENLVNALFSVANLFTEAYMWTYDMSVYPWRVGLKKINEGSDPQFYIREEYNQLTVSANRTMTDLCTRLYLLGYGEGDNQLTISEINGGKPYLQSPQAYINKYGLISKVYVDRQFEDAASLMERGKALLAALQEPQYQRVFKVAELNEITGISYDRAEIGDISYWETDGTKAYITALKRSADADKPGNLEIEMSTTPGDIAENIADLADRQRIEQVYSQGATQIYAQSVQANADKSTPAVLNFHIPSEMRIVNKVLAKISLERFRSYSKVTGGGGKTKRTSEAGGAIFTTSKQGGGVNSNTSKTLETTVSAAQRVMSYFNYTSTALVDGYQSGNTQMSLTGTTGRGGSGYTGTGGGASTGQTAVNTLGASHSHTNYSHTHPTTDHTHSVPAHQHQFPHNHSVTVKVTVPEHSHQIPGHTHSFKVDPHEHTIDVKAHYHDFEIPDHTHTIVQGIFRFGSPKSAQIQIGSKTVATMTTEREIDLTNLLANSSGKIPRGSWIKLGVLPDDLAYITIDIIVQGFVQSRGGGSY